MSKTSEGWVEGGAASAAWAAARAAVDLAFRLVLLVRAGAPGSSKALREGNGEGGVTVRGRWREGERAREGIGFGE